MPKLTDRSIQALKPKNVRYEVWEGHGFGLRVGQAGRKSFIFLYRHEGKARRMTLGAYPRLSLADARLAFAEAHKAVSEGKDPGAELVACKRAARDAETVQELVDEYLSRHAYRHKKSAAADERMLKAEVLPLWGKRKATSITRRDIIAMLDYVVARGSPVTANRLRSLLGRVFGFGVERKILGASPFVHIKKPAKEKPRERVLTPSEIATFWHGLDDAKMSPLTRLALKFLLVTAQRREEVVCAPWSEFDLDEAMWELPGTRTKNGLAHRVPLSGLALDLLGQINAECGASQWLFPSPGDGPMRPDAVSHALRNNLEAIGLQSVTPHDLRRSAVSMMTAMGISRLVTEKVINHKDRGVAGIYDRFGYEQPKREALEAWGERLREIISGTTPSEKVVRLYGEA